MTSAVIKWRFSDSKLNRYWCVPDENDVVFILAAMTKPCIGVKPIVVLGVHRITDDLPRENVECALEYDRGSDEYVRFARNAYYMSSSTPYPIDLKVVNNK